VRTIDDELRWRESEMALAKIHLYRALGDVSAFRFAYRCFAAMTYAHFEGFSKKVIAQALANLAASGITQSACNTTIQITLLAPLARKKIVDLSNEELVNLVYLDARALDSVPFPPPEEILKIANMNFTNFAWAVSCVGLSPLPFETYRGTVNHLTALRHECAHGSAITFDATKSDRELAVAMFQLQTVIVNLMHELSVELIDHFQQGRYRRL
jgi:MAE_28990/MAE_18760-like HEPN